MINSLASQHTAVSQAHWQSEVAAAVAAKQLDIERAVGDAIGELLDEAVQLSKQPGLGINFDAVA